MREKINGEMCVEVLKSYPHTALKALDIAFHLRTDSRAVATALRKPVKDGRVKTILCGSIWAYKFVRSTPAKKKGGAA